MQINEKETKKRAKGVFNGKIHFCSVCGCILEFRYAYVRPCKFYVLGYACVNRSCPEFMHIGKPSDDEINKLSRLGFPLRRFP
jgi:hypothetical protein